jgi:hypothetical protein
MTNGQRLMSVTFNPGQREDIKDIKQSFADAFDIAEKHFTGKYPEGVYHGPVDDKEAIANYQLAWDAYTNMKKLLHLAQMEAVYAVTR